MSCKRPTGVSKSPEGSRSIIAEMRSRVVIETLTLASDGMGGSTSTWSTYATIWARLEPRLGRERYFGQRIEDNITHILTSRYVSGITTTMRVSFDSRIFQIKSVTSPYEAKEYLVIQTEEKVGT
jgi:SPP1 family predicted phage head-tail adaptor